jgi:hypothetical protein
MLGAVASFHFKPHERDEPFGPMARFGDRRTAQPSDFVGEPVAILAAQIDAIGNPALRARIADVVWLLERKRATAGHAALAAYCEIVEGVRDGRFSFHGTGIEGYDVSEHLRRAVQLAKALGWETQPSRRVRDLVADLRVRNARERRQGGFLRLAALDLDYRISDADVIATEAESLAGEHNEWHARHSLLRIAGRAYRHGGRATDSERCFLAAAECLVSVADASGGSAMFETHWLERAIAELHHVPNTKERRRELKHRLVDAQSRIIDEMSRASYGEDISELIHAASDAVSGQPLMTALRKFALLSLAPIPESLEEDARSQIKENPLSYIFPMTKYDSSGKPVHRDGGMDGGSEGSALQRQIALLEQIRRSLTAQGKIEPARVAILDEHFIDERAIGLICYHSPFVPENRTGLFTSGFLDFFRGDMIAGLHTLVPQLENSLRHVLRMHGHDTTKLNEDMTQENLSLTSLLDRLRPELDAILGANLVTDIDNVFNHPSGPNLRNRLAHGLLSDWDAFGHDSIYACWVIFQLCCLPLLRAWDELASQFEASR